MTQERHQRLKIPIHKSDAKTVAAIFKQFPVLRRYFSDADRTMAVWKTRIKAFDTDDPGTLEQTTDIEEIKASPAWGGENMVKVIRYIVFLYDEGTDLTDEFPDDVRLRKEAAAKEAGFRRDPNGNWPGYVSDIMEFKDLAAVDLIMQFLRAQGNAVWRELKMIEEELESIYRQRARLASTGDISKNNDLLQVTKLRNDEKEDLIKKFYGAHHDLREATEKDLLPVSPENVFSVMDFPVEYTRITQIRDVPAAARPH